MRKILFCSLVALLSSTFSFAQTVKQWKTVQTKTIKGSTNVLSATIFTPKTAGVYRISATFIQRPVEGASTDWIAAFFWIDQMDTSAESLIKLSPEASWGSTVFMFNPAVGKPVTYEIEETEGLVSDYRLELTVEEFE